MTRRKTAAAQVTVPAAEPELIPLATLKRSEWPNGSGVFTVPEGKTDRRELGRVERTAGVWRVWRRVDGGYSDMGEAASQVSGIMMLPDPESPPAGLPHPVLASSSGANAKKSGAKPISEAHRGRVRA